MFLWILNFNLFAFAMQEMVGLGLGNWFSWWKKQAAQFWGPEIYLSHLNKKASYDGVHW